MPCEYTAEPDGNLVLLKVWGEVTMDERFETITRLIADENINRGAGFLFNVSKVSRSPTYVEMDDMSSLIRKLLAHSGGHIAMIDGNASHLASMRILANLVYKDGPVRVRVFDNELPAREWLKREAAYAGIHPVE